MENHEARFVFVAQIKSPIYLEIYMIQTSGARSNANWEFPPHGGEKVMGLVREYAQNALRNSWLGIIVICPDLYMYT